MSIPKPKNTGDIYRVEGYRDRFTRPHYGVIYTGSDPNDAGHWCWWIQMDDGKLYPWPNGAERPNMDFSTMGLVRRNPLPDWEKEVSNAHDK